MRLVVKRLRRLLPAALGLLALAAAPKTARYGENFELKPTALEDSAAAALIEVQPGRDGEPLRLDPRLAAAARELAREVQDDPGRQDEIISSGHALEVIDRVGVYDAAIHVRSLGFRSEGDIISGVRLHYGPDRIPAMTHLGVGLAPPRADRPVGIAVVLLTDRRAALEPFPRAVPCPSSWILRGRLVNSARSLEPTVAMTRPGGATENLTVSRDREFFSAEVTFPEPGLYRVEVVAVGGGKTEMSALLKVRAGDLPHFEAEVFTVEGPETSPRDPAEAELMIQDMVNRVRRQEGLSLLPIDPALARMARAHAEDMKANNYVGHLSPTAGGLAQRAKAAGVRGRVSENVALNSSLSGAMNSLLESPVHRRAMLDGQATSLGVGVAIDDADSHRHYYVVQEFGRDD